MNSSDTDSLVKFETNDPSAVRMEMERRLTDVMGKMDKGDNFQIAKESLAVLDGLTVAGSGHDEIGREHHKNKLKSLILETGLAFAMTEIDDVANSPEYKRFLDIVSDPARLSLLQELVLQSATFIRDDDIGTADRASLGLPIFAANTVVRTVLDNRRQNSSNEEFIENISEETLEIKYPKNHIKEKFLPKNSRPSERMRYYLNQGVELALANATDIELYKESTSLAGADSDHSKVIARIEKDFGLYFDYFSNDNAELAQRLGALNKGRLLYGYLSSPASATLKLFNENAFMANQPENLVGHIIDSKIPKVVSILQAGYVNAMYTKSLNLEAKQQLSDTTVTVLNAGLQDFFSNDLQMSVFHHNNLHHTTSGVDSINVTLRELSKDIKFEPGFFKENMQTSRFGSLEDFRKLAENSMKRLSNYNYQQYPGLQPWDLYVFAELARQTSERIAQNKPVSMVLKRGIEDRISLLPNLWGLVESDVETITQSTKGSVELVSASASLVSATEVLKLMSSNKQLESDGMLDRGLAVMVQIVKMEIPAKYSKNEVVLTNFQFAKRNALQFLAENMPNSEKYASGQTDPLQESVNQFMRTIGDSKEMEAVVRTILINEGAFSKLVADSSNIERLRSALGVGTVDDGHIVEDLAVMKIKINRVQLCVLSVLNSMVKDPESWDPDLVASAKSLITEIGQSEFTRMFLKNYGNKESNPYLTGVREILRSGPIM